MSRKKARRIKHRELYNDRNGEDLEDKHNDVFIRGIIAFISGYLIMLFVTHSGYPGIFAGMGLAIGYHFLFFDYLIAAILHARGIIKYDRYWEYDATKDAGRWKEVRLGWFSYLGEKGTIDNVNFWRELPPFWRLIIRLIVFESTLLLYQYFHV